MEGSHFPDYFYTILIHVTQLLQYQIQTSEMWSSTSHAGYEWVEHVN